MARYFQEFLFIKCLVIHSLLYLPWLDNPRETWSMSIHTGPRNAIYLTQNSRTSEESSHSMWYTPTIEKILVSPTIQTNFQCGDIRRWGLWEVIKVRMKPSRTGLVPLRPQRTNSLTPSTRHFLVHRPDSESQTWFSPDTEYVLVLGFLSLQNCEKLICSYNLFFSLLLYYSSSEWQYPPPHTHTPHTHTQTHTELRAD